MSVGVNSPVSWVKSTSRIVYFLICSGLETFLFASATAESISAIRSAFFTRSAIAVPAGRPLRSTQPGRVSGSRVISAPMNG
ncbi:Uncharacterised protein [Mycobacteroides abscessus subsp. abscessus]|nr:Uncharacterised protein [Mycobacteroides abscessus subsp. abscessus]